MIYCRHQKIFDEKFPLKHMSYKCESSVIENGIEKEMIMEVDEVKNELNEKYIWSLISRIIQ